VQFGVCLRTLPWIKLLPFSWWQCLSVWCHDNVDRSLTLFISGNTGYPSGGLFLVCFPGVTTHCVCIFHSPVAGFSLLVFEVPWSHTTTVGLLWTSDQSVAETSTWQHITITTDKYPCPRWDSNPQSQQTNGRRPTSQTARPLGPAYPSGSPSNCSHFSNRY
jgi:hypothetical protein